MGSTMSDFDVSVGLFPGQGSYRENCLRDAWLGADDVVTETFTTVDEAASRMLGKTVTDQIFRLDPPSADELIVSAPDVLQLAIFGASASAFGVLDACRAAPTVLVGHSLGEIAALVCAGAYSLREGAAILCHRILVLRKPDPGIGRMLAIACGEAEAEQILALVADPHVTVAVENGPRQTVVSGPPRGVEKVRKVADAIGLGATVLRSPYPFHSPLLAAAQEEFVRAVRMYPRRPFTKPVFSPVIGRFYRDGDDLAELLSLHLVAPVRFGQAVRRFYEHGTRIFVELGPGSALIDLVRQSYREATVLATLDRPDWDRFAEVAAFLTHGPPPEAQPGPPPEAPPGPPPETPPGPPPEATHPVPEDRPPAALPAPDAASAPHSREALFAEVRTLYAAALEYPDEVFEEGVLLEAELGVDSLTQTMLIRRLQERFGLEPTADGFRLTDYDTFGKIVDLVATAVLVEA
jgi:acyl transferase domain-containing protein